MRPGGPVWAVVRREYLQRVRSKWFVLTTVGAPLLFAALMVLPIWLGGEDGRTERRLALVDRTGALHEEVARRLEAGGFEVEVRAGSDDRAVAELTRRASIGEIGGFLVLDQETLDRGRAHFVGGEAPSVMREVGIRSAVVQSALAARLEGTGADVEALLAGGELEVDVLSAGPSGMEDPRFIAVYMGTFVLYMVILLYAVAVMRSVLEEKTNRIVEVVISSMRPWHLMLGKILGVGAVGLTQLAVWTTAGTLLATTGLPALAAARPELLELDAVSELLPGAGFAGLFLVFFLCGYFLYSALYAAVGAMCNSDQEAQQAQTPVVLLLIVPVVLLIGVMESPNSTLSVTLSLIPFFSPILMFARAGMGAAPPWQIALSVALMVVSVVAVAWVAGRIYRTGILMSGKRPTLPELWRWVRQS